MGSFLIPITISFLIGSFGYILVYFWLRPLFKYKKIKRQVKTAFVSLNKVRVPPKQKLNKTQLRQLAAELAACYHETLPDWYKLLLKNRGEDPLQASKILMTMANTTKLEHRIKQVTNLIAALKFPETSK